MIKYLLIENTITYIAKVISMNKIIISILISFNLYSSDLTDQISKKQLVVSLRENILQILNHCGSLNQVSKCIAGLSLLDYNIVKNIGKDNKLMYFIYTWLKNKFEEIGSFESFQNDVINKVKSSDGYESYYEKYIEPLIFLAVYSKNNYLITLLNKSGINTNIDNINEMYKKYNIIDMIGYSSLFNEDRQTMSLEDVKALDELRQKITLLIKLGFANFKCMSGDYILHSVIMKYNKKSLEEYGDFFDAAYGQDLFNIVKLLIANGADVNSRNKLPRTQSGFTPLIDATAEDWIDVVKLLIDNGADINDQNNRDKCSPLMMAYRKGNKNIAKLLRDNGAKY